MQITRHWRLNSQRYRLEGVRYVNGETRLSGWLPHASLVLLTEDQRTARQKELEEHRSSRREVEYA